MKRDGEAIGNLLISFRKDGDQLQVDSTYTVEIRLMSIVLYRYRKTMSETYADGKLTAYRTEIDDNGTKSDVTVQKKDDGLIVFHPDGHYVAPADLIVTTYWPAATVHQTRMIDSSDGVIVDVKTSEVGTEDITVDGRSVPARHFRMTGDLERDLWYAATDGEWLKMRMKASDGSTIEITRDWPPLWKRGL